MSQVHYIVANLLSQVLPPPKAQRQPRRQQSPYPKEQLSVEQRSAMKRLLSLMEEAGYNPNQEDTNGDRVDGG